MSQELIEELRFCLDEGFSGPRTQDALRAAIREMERAQHAGEADKLLKELGDIRALFPEPEEGSPLEGHWIDAMSDPYSVADYVRACIAAPQPSALPEGWQPIETAPKDREIWAFNGEQARMQWSEGDGWALWIWCDALLSDADPSPDQPTHWMPLPAAPQPRE